MSRNLKFKFSRIERQMTQFDLSLATGIVISRIQRFESGYTQPTKAEVQKIAEVLHANPEQLFDMIDNKIPSKPGFVKGLDI